MIPLRELFRKAAKLFLMKLPIAFIAISIAWVTILRWVPVWFTPLMVCRSMFVDVDNPMRGKAMHCHLSTLLPISMSIWSSLLKKLMM